MALHPGAVNTNLAQHLWMPLRFLVLFFVPFLKTAREGAQTTIHCALLDPPKAMIAGALYYYRYPPSAASLVLHLKLCML